MPEFNRLNIEPARRKIKELFISRIIEAKGLSRIQEMCKTDIIPTPLAVLNACELLSKGTKNMPGLGDLLAVDIGGATTDVYSISDGRPTLENVTVKGLPEPVSKRTVEGDLGMRYSLPSLVDELDLDAFSKELSIDRSEVVDWVKTCTQHPGLLAEAESREQKIEELIAQCRENSRGKARWYLSASLHSFRTGVYPYRERPCRNTVCYRYRRGCYQCPSASRYSGRR